MARYWLSGYGMNDDVAPSLAAGFIAHLTRSVNLIHHHEERIGRLECASRSNLLSYNIVITLTI